MQDPDAQPAWKPISYAIYLGTSWTWCIGMFLPLLLMRDFGWPAWFVFAIPNVLGAAAMGWILKRPRASEELVRAHRSAMLLFSCVTLVFQGVFAAQMLAPLDHLLDAWSMRIACLLVLLGAAYLPRITGVLVWLASAGILIVLAATQGRAALGAFPVPLKSPWELLYMAPVCVFGFLLCPYMDLTFHRARQRSTARSARTAFGLGFGVFFLVMILGTPLYGQLFWTESARSAALLLPVFLAAQVHIGLQLAYTAGVHFSELREHTQMWRGRWAATALSGLIVLAIWLAASLSGFSWPRPGSAPLLAGSDNATIGWYRFFLSAYGLVFPAYVWICMIPRGESRIFAPGTRRILLWLGACAAAAPFYWAGFLERQTVWLVPGILIVLVARFIPVRRASAVLSAPSPG